MICFLDTSVVLRRLFGEKPALKGWGSWQEAYVSELVRVEALRTLDRLFRQRSLDEERLADAIGRVGELLDHLGEVALSRSILSRASQSFPTPLKTLDALHLATALLWQEQKRHAPIFLTHDRHQATAARAAGLLVSM